MFVTTEGEVKILDFNVSKLIGGDSHKAPESSKWQYSMFTKTGTPIYTPPELHLDFRYSEAVDMWGVGTVLYTMLSGEVPFTEKK